MNENIVRIPARYMEQISFLPDKDKLWIFWSSMELWNGKDVVLKKDMKSSFLSMIFREALLMAKKNTNFNKNSVGKLVAGDPEHIADVTRELTEHNITESNVIETPPEEISQIIKYLNSVVKKNFKDSTTSTVKSINARLEEGYSVSDFQYVIDVKAKEWMGTSMSKYLTPDTLFRPSHFEKYLNQTNEYTEKDMISEYNTIGFNKFREKYGQDKAIDVSDMIAG